MHRIALLQHIDGLLSRNEPDERETEIQNMNVCLVRREISNVVRAMCSLLSEQERKKNEHTELCKWNQIQNVRRTSIIIRFVFFFVMENEFLLESIDLMQINRKPVFE